MTKVMILTSALSIFHSFPVAYHLTLLMHGVYISQLIRYARCYSHYDDFRYCHKCLVDRLLSQGYIALRLENSSKKFYERYLSLIEKIPEVSQGNGEGFIPRIIFIYLTCSGILVAFVIYMDLSLGFVDTLINC